ncbi:MAG: RluA family pseudouridine synthase [Endomicrobiia bacterium]
MEKRCFKITEDIKNKRVDKYLKEVLKEYSREYVKVLCKNKMVKVNNRYVDPDKEVSFGDEIEIFLPEREDFVEERNVKVENLDIIYEDDELLVINKPAFLKVHPAKKFDKEITLIDLLIKKFPYLKNKDWVLNRPFLVHRLDKETSGVLLIAKTPKMQFVLSKQFQQREIKKIYRAIVSGEIKISEGEIVAPIKKEKNLSKINFLGKQAETKFKVISSTKNFSYLELYPKTGRTHQIRTHLKFIGYPIIGDIIYGGVAQINNKNVPRIMLHAYGIEFFDPRSKKCKKFVAEIPEDFKFFLSYLSLQ